MNKNTTRYVGAAGFLVLTMLALVAVPLGPAAADEVPPPGQVAGTGHLEGTERVDEWEWTGGGLCLAQSKSIYAVRGTGTYSGRAATGQEVIYRAEIGPGQTLYTDGPIQVEVENPQPYYHGPYGTHGTSDATCAPATAGTPIAADFRIFTPDHIYRLDGTGQQVPCAGEGSFKRGEPDSAQNTEAQAKWWAEWRLSADCTVVGNAAGTPGSGVATAGTIMTHLGAHDPCFNWPCVNNLRVDYKQYPRVIGPYLNMGGPDSAETTENVTVSARLTNDGAGVADAPVNFSVTGPGVATPAGGTALTGPNGTAAFTFTAVSAGDYTVTATTTYNAGILTSSHTVSFRSPPPIALALGGPSSAQTEEDISVVATVTGNGEPAPGAEVDFTVAGPGQASPAQGAATSDANGRATFVFRADRAGDYTVTAAATRLGEQASATHAVHLEINTFSVAGSIPSEPGEGAGGSAVVDPAGNYAYFGGRQVVEKIDLKTFQRVGVLSVSPENLTAAVIDPAGRYAYFGSSINPKIFRIDLATFQLAGTLTLPEGDKYLFAAVIDPEGRYAYFGTKTVPARIVKVDLAAFQRVGGIVLASGETQIRAAVISPDGQYAYFGADGADTSNRGGVVVKVDLGAFQRVAATTVTEPAADSLTSAVIDGDGRFAYFGTGLFSSGAARSRPGQVVKVDLATLQPVATITLEGAERDLSAAVIHPGGDFAYFGTNPTVDPVVAGSKRPTPVVVKIDLRNFRRVHGISVPSGDLGMLVSAAISPAGDAMYFKKVDHSATGWDQGQLYPAKLYKVAVSRPPAAWLHAADDTYSTPYASPLSVPAPGVLANDADTGDGDPLTAGQASDPPHGSVTLNPDGSFTYTPDSGFSGTDTFTYTATDRMDYSAPATVSVAVAPPPDGVASVSGGAFAFYTNVGLFGGPQAVRGGPGSNCGQPGQPACGTGQSPSVSLPPSGADLSASDPDGGVGQYGPAFIFESHGPMAVGAEGTTGPDGSVTASASVADISDNDPFHAHAPDGAVSSTCTATESGLVGSARIVNGRLVTSTDPVEGTPTSEVTLPHVYDPAPNTTYEGSLDHVGDRWRIVFNEQILGPDSITVNAVHMYLLGSTAIGDMIIGQSRCGVETFAPNAAPVAADDAYSVRGSQPLAIDPSGVLANDTDAEGQPLRASTLAPLPPPSSGGGEWTFPGRPANGTLRLNHDGSFTYTASDGFTGIDSFSYVASDSRGRSDTAVATITVEPAHEGEPPVADFDGDGDTDVSVFRPSSAIWFVHGGATTAWGTQGDIAAPADYDGDGTTDQAVFRPSLGLWFVQPSGGGPESAVAWGADGDVAVPGDYDGDGRADLAVFRPSSGTWFVKASTAGESATAWGTGGDVAVPADYDGDGRTDPAVFRPSLGVWFVNASGTGASAVAWGTDGDVPVPGDYDGDGRADLAVFRPSAGVWFVQASTAGASSAAWGVSGDVPTPGDYDGNGTTDVAVFRPSAGVWFVNGGAVTFWGTDGDVPLPLPAAVRQAVFSGG